MEMRLILLNVFKSYDFRLDPIQEQTLHDPTYMGVNTFTMGPLNVKDRKDIFGMHVQVIPRYSRI